ncbi:heavy-metal-associated domain-containing protein [Brachybacterium sp. Marseille-Q2903]|uniref:Heavy-metal-associated domain-containing protein n=1 Tax=Brachybacterium epidermidis TaxID=2781983 RepID=A0ABR9W2Y3_9MICO|nr:heavy-metal-associated domain-containing protein [Brachybacterium epidermidis]MBE9404809.1 heavy-metal-associated domain-containing protein [Brachybacterium epidermidis]
MSTSTYGLTGLTCGHCVNAVTEEVSAIEGVSDVTVDLVTGGTSTLTLTTDREVSKDALAAAVDEAGDYQLTDAPA